MSDCSGFDLFETNGSWYINKFSRPERAIVPPGFLPSAVNYAVETEPAYYSPYTHVTLVPTFAHTASGVVNPTAISQTRLVLNSVISQNQSSIDGVLNSRAHRQ